MCRLCKALLVRVKIEFSFAQRCHRDSSGNDYFCQKNLCLPPKYEVTEALRLAQDAEEKFVRDAADADSSYVVVDEDKGIVRAVDATFFGNFDATSP